MPRQLATLFSTSDGWMVMVAKDGGPIMRVAYEGERGRLTPQEIVRVARLIGTTTMPQDGIDH